MPQDELENETESFDEEMYMEILRDDPPMKRYVSRGDTPDSVDIAGPHKAADRAILRCIRFTIKDNTARFQPILGEAGMGKTHLFWSLKDKESIFAGKEFLAVYVPSPPAPVRIPLHLHACLVDEAGERIFDETVDMLISKFGGVRGVTHEQYDFDYAMERLLARYPGISADVVKTLMRYRLDPGHRDLARRWLFGDAVGDEELEELGVRTVLEEDDVTVATLNLLMEGSERTIVFFIDETEGLYNTHGEEAERRFLEILKRIYNEGKNVVLVASCLTEVWDRIYEIADAPMQSRMEETVNLRPFTKDDLTSFVEKSMKQYWNEKNIDPPPNPIFPLDPDDIEESFNHSEGVPREAIKFIIPRLDSILFDIEEEPEPQADYVIKLTASVVINAIVEALKLAAEETGGEVQLHMAKGGTSREATAIVKVKKNDESSKICIDVANVKDWNRSGGVAGYYSVKRVKEILESDEADYGVVAVPEETGGAKFEAMREDLGELLTTLRFTEKTATQLVESTKGRVLTSEEAEMFGEIVKSV
ncbi:MAG: hypothetical protein R6V83_08575 [Candidatus Thorarchaeota archaeon]